MEKTLTVDGRQVTFKKTGATMLAYKRQTGRDFYSDLSSFLGCMSKTALASALIAKNDGKKIKIEPSEINFEKFDTDYMYDMLHIMARSADKSIPSDTLEWLDMFDSFPVVQIFCEILPMLSQEMKIDAKN